MKAGWFPCNTTSAHCHVFCVWARQGQHAAMVSSATDIPLCPTTLHFSNPLPIETNDLNQSRVWNLQSPFHSAGYRRCGTGPEGSDHQVLRISRALNFQALCPWCSAG